ncbi:MAG: nucleoside-diphosphate kinase [Planctomycetota bacterium]
MERTLIILKPDAVQRRLVGEITSRFERKGLRVAALKLMKISTELAERHYAPHKGKGFYKSLIQFMTSEPVVAMVLEGHKAVDVCRKLMGKTFGYDAEPGTIRGDFGISNQFNLVHGSDSADTARREVELFFTPAEIHTYKLADDVWHAAE